MYLQGVTTQKFPFKSYSASATLLATQSGSAIGVVGNGTTTITLTLPTAAAGLRFKIFPMTTVMSGGKGINIYTGSASIFFGGSQLSVDNVTPSATLGPKLFAAAGTETYINWDALVQGGALGSQVELIAVSSTLWIASSVARAIGTVVTPFTTAALA